MAYVYILYSEKADIYYVGSTNDLQSRLERHNKGTEKFTKRGVLWKLVYSAEYPTKRLPTKREYEIKKKKSRKFIEQLIAKTE